MKVKYQIGSVLGGEVVDKDVRWLIVYDKYDQPIAAIEQVTDDDVFITSCSDEKFRDVIKRYGINKLQRTEVLHDRS